MSKWDQYVYSYVPRNAVESVLNEGLFGGEALLKRPDLLELAAKNRKVSAKTFAKEIKDNLSSWAKDSSKGPNIVFQLIPKNFKLPSNHPVKKYKLIPIKINLTKLLADYPDSKIFGMELQPYSEDANIKDRHHFLTKKELQKLLTMSAHDIWNSYNDIEQKGLYAPDVPHACVQTRTGLIPPIYLSRANKTSTAGHIANSVIRNRTLFLERLCNRNRIS